MSLTKDPYLLKSEGTQSAQRINQIIDEYEHEEDRGMEMLAGAMMTAALVFLLLIYVAYRIAS
jgi:hypothetical protein